MWGYPGDVTCAQVHHTTPNARMRMRCWASRNCPPCYPPLPPVSCTRPSHASKAHGGYPGNALRAQVHHTTPNVHARALLGVAHLSALLSPTTIRQLSAALARFQSPWGAALAMLLAPRSTTRRRTRTRVRCWASQLVRPVTPHYHS